ncbi:MAG: hypothetical protein KUG82_15795 [Pseudomonadales bacterium]|nr:hypothetical protein [Pseudomonadales bacterium]
MESGLQGQKKSLAMLPTYISAGDSPTGSLKPAKRNIVIDAGGTHLRVALTQVSSTGEIEFIHLKKHPMPGQDKAISAEFFYDTICHYLAPVIALSDQINFCFSYPCEINSQLDGKLLYWTKEIKAPEVVGQWIGQSLRNQIKHRFNQDKKIILLNDTVATLLAGKCAYSGQSFDASIGFILGTGTNCAYSGFRTKQIINMESGNFNGAQAYVFDCQLDESSVSPGQYLFEKKIGGQYLGTLLRIALQHATQHSLFNQTDSKLITSISVIETKDFSRILENDSQPWYNRLSTQGQSTTLALAQAIRDRAAWLTAINIAGAVIKSLGASSDVTSLSCFSISKTCLITIDGSTYYNTPGFKSQVEFHLQDHFEDRNITLTFCQIDNAPLKGAALAKPLTD